DFTACDVSKFDGTLDPAASARWLSAVDGAFRTSCCKEKNKVNFASNFLRNSAKMWWDGKVYEKKDFQTLMQTNETVNELWNKVNDLIPYCPEYHGNEKLNVERFQIRVREADLLRKKNKEAKETKRKLEFGDRDTKKPKHDHGRRSGETQTNTLWHKSNECPNPKAIKAKPMKSIKEEKAEKAGVPNLKARVYVMAAEEDKLVHDVFTCTIPVNSIPAHVLYDSGAIEIADSKVLVVSNVYRDVEIEIDDIIFKIDLIPIMLGVFDIVIGMDRL
ncbi:hypothetical protein Tco_1488426, partial [Tanacetum coccineum]